MHQAYVDRSKNIQKSYNNNSLQLKCSQTKRTKEKNKKWAK